MFEERTAIKELRKRYSQVSIDPEKTIEVAREANRLAVEKGLLLLSQESRLLEAYAHNALGDSVEAIKIAGQVYDQAKQSQSVTNVVRAMNMMSIIYFHSHQYDRAIRTIVHAMDYIEELDDHQLIAAVYNNLAEVYFASKDYYYASQYYEFALEQALQDTDLMTIKSVELSLGITQLQLLNPDEAKIYFESAIKRGKREDDPLTHAEIEYRLAMIYLSENRHEEADELLSNSESVLLSVSNSLYLVNYYYHRAISDLRLGDGDRVKYLRQALQYAEALGAKKKVSDILLALSDVHERIGNPSTALVLFKQHHHLEKELESAHLVMKLEILKEELEQTNGNPHDLNFEETLIKEIALERSRGHRLHEANQVLKKLAHNDELTGIPNRRSINDKLSLYLNSNESLALYMIDIDHFKRYNDAFGHLSGDACLVEISKLLQQHAERHADFVGRYGGEEFLYIGRVSNYEEAHTRAEELRKLVENHQVRYRVNDFEHQVTICIGGVYAKNSMAFHKEYLLRTADQQLYQAKGDGRNQARILEVN